MRTYYKVFYAPDKTRLLSLPHTVTTVGQAYDKQVITKSPATGPIFAFAYVEAAVRYLIKAEETNHIMLELWECEGQSINELIGVSKVIHRDILSKKMCTGFWKNIYKVAPTVCNEFNPALGDVWAGTINFQDLDNYYALKIDQFQKAGKQGTPFEPVPYGNVFLAETRPIRRIIPQ